MAAVPTAHLWLPATVDAVRSVVGFGPISRLERAVYEALDTRQPANPTEVQLLWSPPPACAHRTTMEVAHATVDPERPDVTATFVRMDLQRLRPVVMASGIPPSGAVAAFNGAFQRDHGRFGLRVDGNTLVPATIGAATLAVDGQGQTRLWAWTGDDTEGAWTDLRQNLALLYDRDRTPRVLSELTLIADGREEKIGLAPTRRSGVCIDGDALIYVWSKRATAATMAAAMEIAGCERGMHLDANTFHTRFEFLDGDCAHPAAPDMTDGPAGRYLRAQDRDFFALVPRR